MTRVPPHNLEAEQATLGAMLTVPSAIPVVLDRLSASDFYRDCHRDVFHAIIELWKRDGGCVDYVTVSAIAPKHKDLIHTLAEFVPAAANAAYYADSVRHLSICRGLIKAGLEIVEMGYDDGEDAKKLVDLAETKVHALRPDSSDGSAYAKDIAHKIMLEIERGDPPAVTSTGFEKLDKICGGLHAGNLIIVGARPGVGKTAVALNIAHQVSRDGVVMFFSLEMSQVELMERVMCMVGGVPVSALRGRNLSADHIANLHKHLGEIETSQLRIIDEPSITMLSLKGKARQYAAKKKIKLIVVDYLQLLRLGIRTESRYAEVSQISSELKAMARELQVPVLALSQLNRASTFNDSDVDISQLRESGSLEQDADQVWLLSWPKDADLASESLKVRIAKNRHGPIGEENFGWYKPTQRIDF